MSKEAFSGITLTCWYGEIQEFVFDGNCTWPGWGGDGSVCCQSGPAESLGGATCIASTEECIEYDGTITTYSPDTTEATGLDCDYVEWLEEAFYAGRDLTRIVQKPIGVCHSDPDLKDGNVGSVIFECSDDDEIGVQMIYYEDQECFGDPAYTLSLAELMAMTNNGMIIGV